MFVIGGLVMDWRISHGFAGWSEIGRELAPDWQHSYSIVRMFFTDWQRIDIELADWSWIANGSVNWLRIARWIARFVID